MSSTSTISAGEEECPEDSESSEDETETDDEMTDEGAREIFEDFIVALSRYFRHTIAVVLMESIKRGRNAGY